jgi:hypothetical protein
MPVEMLDILQRFALMKQAGDGGDAEGMRHSQLDHPVA